MELSKLIANCNVISIKGDEKTEVSAIASDSRQVQHGSLFVAVEGVCADGHSYIGKAIEEGASVIVYDKPFIGEFLSQVTYVQVENSAVALALIASQWYGNPSRHLKLIGVTGTNGKTTVATLLYEMFRRQGYAVGLLSTVCNYVNEKKYPTTHTTLDPIALKK
jgi:UDP-N-acetylmuramoyl-L-alanyl-D-glutamate--2,6-diaminopimelate ligase